MRGGLVTAPARPHSAGVAVRLCTDGDLAALEWDGLFSDHREIIENAFARQRAGTNVMLVAAEGDRIVGQVWIDLEKGLPGAPLLWALRVHPSEQGRGIGTALLDMAEAWLLAHGFSKASIGVEKSNATALRLYNRKGFRVRTALVEHVGFTRPDGVRQEMTLDLWLLQKTLLPRRTLR